jgi:DNA modification methylase
MDTQLQVQYRPLTSLIPYARNPRVHDQSQIAKIMASIIEYGWTNPILVDGTKGILAGHGRLAAAKQLGLADVPVIELGHLTAAQQKAYVIADNRLALDAGWDDELLAAELADLEALGHDLSLTGFDPDELAELLEHEQTNEGLADDDEVPTVAAIEVTKLGYHWRLGSHRLLCGDATDPDGYKVLLTDGDADMTFTDPPYNVNYANSAKDKMRGKNRPILNDNLGEEFGPFLQAAFTPMLEHCTGAVYICMSSSELDTLQKAFRAAGGHWSTFIIWAKNTFTLGRADYQRQYEPILYGWADGSTRHWCGDRNQGDVWNFNKPVKNDLHATMKPVELVERAIRNSSHPGGVVLDPFGGSGSTLIAAEKSGRHARLMELSPAYCDVIIRRWQQWTGKKAVRSDGVVFDDLEAAVLSGLSEEPRPNPESVT